MAAAALGQGGGASTDLPAGGQATAAQVTEPDRELDVAAAETQTAESDVQARLAELRQQAAEAEARTRRPEVRVFARQIVRDQAREIGQMEAQRRAR